MKVLNQEAIRRMISGGTSGAASVSVGGGGDGGLTPAWVEGNYVSKSFFSQLFTIHGTKTVTDPQTGTTTEEEVEITPNQLIDDEYDVTDVEVKFGLWTQQFLSALGKNSSGGGGGGDTLTEPLASINNAGLGAPTAAGQVITWNGSEWIFDIPQGGGGGGSVTSVGLSAPTGFTVNNSPITSSGTIQLGFATGYSLPTNAKQSNWDVAYSWGNHANAGYLTSSDIQDMATQTWVGENYLPLTGGMLTGSLRMGEEEAGSSPYIYWGDGSYVYIGEDADDHMVIRGRYGVNILTDTGYNLQWNNHTLATQTWVNDQGFVKSSGVTSVGMSVPTGLRVNSAASATITGSGTFALSVQSGYFIPTTLQRTTWNGKQDAIADLTTIRSGAALGATSVQPSDIADMATKTWVQQTALSGYATESWVTDNMMKKARVETANIDTLYDAGSYRFGATAEGTWPVASNYGNVLVVRGADDTVAQMFFPYVESKAYLRTGNPIKQNGSWRAWKEFVMTDGNVASATRLLSNDTKTLLGNTYWSGGQPQDVGTSWSNTAHISYISNITMKGTLNGVTTIEMNNNGNGYLHGYGGVIDFHYDASTDDYTSRIIEDKSGRLNFNGTAFIYKSNKPGKDDDFPGGKLDETTDWGSYSFRNVFTNNSLFENTLFLRQSIYMKNGFPIFMKNNAGANVSALVMESDSLVLGSGAYTNAGINTYMRGATLHFQISNAGGSSGTFEAAHYDNTGNFYLDVIGKAINMKDANGTPRNVLQVDTGSTQLAIGYGMTQADYKTNIYGGGGDDKGISFYHGSTTLAAGISGGDHSFVAYYHIKLTTNNQSLYTRNTNSTAIDTVRMGSNNILNFGYGCSTNNHESRLYGGATAGIGFFCGSTEVARVHKDSARQGIRIGDGLLSWDSNNNAFKVSKIDSQGNEVAANLYTLGGVSALGFTAPQGSLDAFHIDYLTSTSVTAQTMQASRFYLNSSIYLYLDGSSLKISNGTTTKTIITL